MNKEELKEIKERVLKVKKAGEIEKVLEYKTAYSRFKDKALEIPDGIALKYFGSNITYRQLLNLIDKAADGFYELGIRYNDVVATSLLGTPYSIVAFYALDKIGAQMHMVNCASGYDEVQRELNVVKSKFFVGNDLFCNQKFREMFKQNSIEKVFTVSLTDGIYKGINFDNAKYSFIEKLKGLKKDEYNGKDLFNFDMVLNAGENSTNKIKECEYTPNKTMAIAYTSGTSGDCKACVATWERIDAMVQIMALTEEGRFKEQDVMFSTFPLWIFYSLLNMIHEPLCLGVSLAFDPLFNPKDMAKRNNQYKFNHWLTIPAYLSKAIKTHRKTDCSNWKIVLTGGGPLTNNLKKKADDFIEKHNGTAKLAQGYGATELLGSFAYGYKENTTIGSIGIPCIGNQIKIINEETGKEVGINESGLAYLYSPTLMKEYYGNEEATQKSLVKDENGVTWYNSEDYLFINEKGELFIDDRKSRMFVTIDSNGNPAKIIPGRIKRAILSLDYISDCEIIALKDDNDVYHSIAVVTCNNADEEILKQSIIEFCSKNIPEYMVPIDVMILDEMPLTSAKKNDLNAIQKLYLEKKKNTNVKKRSLFKKFI